MVSITLGIPTLRRYDLLKKAVESAFTGSVVPSTLCIIDNGGKMPESTWKSIQKTLANHPGVEFDFIVPGKNLGVAASWNQILLQYDDWVIVSNDDVEFYPQTIERLVHAAEQDTDGLFFFPGAGGYKNAWSLYLQKKQSLEAIGLYDEDISPGYGFFEDNDMSRRLELAGYRHIPIPKCGYGHFDSATVKSMSPQEQQEHWRRFGIAKQNYIKKWGGIPGQETYAVPFNKTHG